MLEKWEIPTRKENNGENILPDIAKEIVNKLKEQKIGQEEVQGIGVGVPGPVKADGTVVKCVNVGWGIFNVEETLSELTGLPVKAGNDANVAALGEMWKGGGKGRRNLMLLTLGTGVGGGMIVEGSMISGSNGAGGEIGHVMVNEEETEVCNCGKKGCLEQYASANGILRVTKKALSESDRETSLRNKENLSTKDIFDEAKRGDAFAREMVEYMGKTLGTAIANAACITNPEVIVIGGGVSKAGSIVIDVIEKYFRERTFHACRNAEFVLAELGNDAGIYGGVYLISEESR